MIKEFREFIAKGNVLDLAVGIVIGAAFGGVVKSFVSDILMPPIGLLLGKIDFSNLYVNLSGGAYKSLADAQAHGAATINYGMFINNIINFIIVGFALFLVIRVFNKKKDATTKPCPACTSDIPIGAKRCPLCTSEVE